MAFKEYTSTVKPSNYVDLSGTAPGIIAIITLVLNGVYAAVLIAAFAGGPVGLSVAIALFTLLVIYLIWWLHGRLIFLGGEKCLIGVITGLGPSDPFEKAGDNDFTMNLLLAPAAAHYAEQKTVYWNTQPQGHLLAENPAVLAIGRGYVQDTDPLKLGEDHHKYVASLHCEFEGDGIANLLKWASVILALLIAALLLPPFLAGLAIILAIIFGLSTLGDLFVPPAAPGAGDPADIDPSLRTLARGDVVLVKGEWIYDSLHHGWNEIHPVRACHVIGHMDLPGTKELYDPTIPPTPWSPDLCGIGLDTTPKVQTAIDRWCAELEKCDDAETGGSRDNPEHGWVIHPLVDGCKPPVVIL